MNVETPAAAKLGEPIRNNHGRTVKTDETRIHIVSKEGRLMNEFVTTGTKPNIANVYVGSRLVAELESSNGPTPPATIFGWGYGNSADKLSYTSTFDLASIPDKVTLCIDGYGITYSTEVGVRVNGVLIGYMNPGGDPYETCFELTPSQVLVGTNTVLFTQDIPGQTWGVGGTSAEAIVVVIPFSIQNIIPPIIMLLLDEEEVAQ